ncbi:hypothetical protein AAY473_037774 [Plecturocebus cupreus]
MKLAKHGDIPLQSQLLGKLRQEDLFSPRVQGCRSTAFHNHLCDKQLLSCSYLTMCVHITLPMQHQEIPLCAYTTRVLGVKQKTGQLFGQTLS